MQQHAALTSYGYAITTHKSQGSTYDICVVNAANIMTSVNDDRDSRYLARMLYTAMSRPSKVLTIVGVGQGTDTRTAEELFNTSSKKTEQESVRDSAVTPKNDPSASNKVEAVDKAFIGVTMHSGGAKGADTQWGLALNKYGATINHYYMGDMKAPAQFGVKLEDTS